MKSLLSFSAALFLFAHGAMAQDPTISSPTVSPSPGLVNGAVTFSVNFTNNSSLSIPNPDPVNGPTVVTFSTEKFIPVGGTNPSVTGAGAVYFNWTAFCASGCGTNTPTWVIIGKQKAGVTIPGYTGTAPFLTYAGGAINVAGIISAASTASDAASYNGDGFQANITPGDGGDISNGPGSNEQSAYGYTSGVLPLQLVSFTAVKYGRSAKLQWTTSSEINTDKFIVERSVNNSFTQIGVVAAAGTSTTQRQYTFTDAAPAAGINYYRLRSKDLDGTSSLSAVKSLDFSGDNKIYVSPSPAASQTTIFGLEPKMQITLIGGDGRTIRSYKSTGTTFIVPLDNLAGGMYIVRISDAEGKVIATEKVIKY